MDEDFTVSYDETTGEYVASAGEAVYTSPSGHLAYLWLAAQIQDTGDDPVQPAGAGS